MTNFTIPEKEPGKERDSMVARSSVPADEDDQDAGGDGSSSSLGNMADATGDDNPSHSPPNRGSTSFREASEGRHSSGHRTDGSHFNSTDNSSSVGGELIDITAKKSKVKEIYEVVYQLLFLMVVGNYRASTLFAVASIIGEDIQLLTYFFSSLAAMYYPIPSFITTLTSIPYSTLTTSQFQIYFCCATVACFLFVANVAYVAWGTVRGQHKKIWPISTLRVAASVLPTLFYSPIINILVTPIQCEWQSTGSGSQTQIVSNLGCYDFQRLLFLSFSGLAGLLFIPTSCAMISVYLDMNPCLKGNRNKSHGRVDLIYITLKTILICCWRFVPSPIIQFAVGYCTCTFMFLSIMFYQPYFNARFNQLRAANYCASMFAGAMSLIGVGVSTYGSVSLPWFYTILMVIVVLIGYATGWYFCEFIYIRVQEEARRALENMYSNVHSSQYEDDTIIFRFWPHVEMTARFIVEALDNRRRRVDMAKFGEVKRIFKRGLQEFPEEAYIRLQYATYLFHLTNARQEALRSLKRIKSLDPSFDVSCQIHFLNQINQQMAESEFLGSGVQLDVTSFADFQKSHRTATRNHQIANAYITKFWSTVVDKKTTVFDVESVGLRLYSTSQKADNAYLSLVSRFPKSQYFLRMYAKFCFDVTNDIEKGNALVEKADFLEGEEQADGSVDDLHNIMTLEREPRSSPQKSQASRLNRVPEERASVAQRVRNMDKHESRSQAPSSTGTTSADDYKAMQERMRMRSQLIIKRNRDMKSLTIASNIMGLMSLAAAVTNSILCAHLLQYTIFGTKILQGLHSRERFSAWIPYRARALQAAYLANDTATFNQQQLLLRSEMDQYNYWTDWLFSWSDIDPATFSWYNDPSIAVNLTAYPYVNQPFQEIVSGYDLTKRLASSGYDLSYKSFSAFANISYDNSFRFVMDNFRYLHVYYDYSMNDCFFAYQSATAATAATTITELTIVYILVVIALVVILDFGVMSFLKLQRKALSFFKEIPAQIIKEHINKIELERSEDIFFNTTSNLAVDSESVKQSFASGKWGLRLQYGLYVMATCTLAGVFYYINVMVSHNGMEAQ
ncbi:uncharacterized protein BJ171DRAFT_89508 [Polychytrium aggregatum]|uniref:uncharacterized protein n=1 Tax=Polychytrium aggregatum TaxID=110093 RepID=UPI0022FE8052|nr:uncharacterized protein BJ171DRAFT_89508 [Polychytrium aggregatum]KAI9204775.1 hypothetical protein BJ171DRAFT_89508 [Polychytrium aggregatum]